MLPLRNRLKLPTTWDRRVPDFQTSTPHFKLLAKNTSQGEPRVGFIITAKIGKAVERNRLRRKLSELLKPRIVNLKPGVEIVIIVYSQSLNANDQDLSTSLNQAVSKIPLPGSS